MRKFLFLSWLALVALVISSSVCLSAKASVAASSRASHTSEDTATVSKKRGAVKTSPRTTKNTSQTSRAAFSTRASDDDALNLSREKTPPLLQVTTGRGTKYSRKLHGRKTANGERYHSAALTAAHRFLPFNTVIRVTNLHNGREVVARINDRGPFGKNLILDVSYESAKRLNMLRAGVVKMQVEVLTDKKGKISQPGMGFYLACIPVSSPIRGQARLQDIEDELGSKIRASLPKLRVIKEDWPERQPSWFIGAGPFYSFKDVNKAFEKVRTRLPDADIVCIPVDTNPPTPTASL